MISWIGQIEFIREEFWFKNDIVYRLFKLVLVLRNKPFLSCQPEHTEIAKKIW